MRYDTDTATLIHEWSNGRWSKDLYRTQRGEWFIRHYGGPMTDNAVKFFAQDIDQDLAAA